MEPAGLGQNMAEGMSREWDPNLKQLVPPGLDADLTRNYHGCSYHCRGYRVALRQVFKVSNLNFASRFILE